MSRTKRPANDDLFTTPEERRPFSSVVSNGRPSSLVRSKSASAVIIDDKLVTGRRGETHHGVAQGDHVTAYAVVDKAIKNCVSKILQASKDGETSLSAERKVVERQKFLKILCGVIGVLCEEDKQREAEIVGNIQEIISAYELKRDNLYNAQRWIAEEGFASIGDKTVFKTIAESVRDAKSSNDEKILEQISGDMLTHFNNIPGLSFPKNPKYLPPETEANDVKEAVGYFSKLEQKEIEASASESGRSVREGAGMLGQQTIVDKHVKNLFFYPKYRDADLGRGGEPMMVRNNSQNLLEKFVARHLFLVMLSYPVLKKYKLGIIIDNFCTAVAGDWKIQDQEKFSTTVKLILNDLEQKLEEGKESLKIKPSPKKGSRVVASEERVDEGYDEWANLAFAGVGSYSSSSSSSVPSPSSPSSIPQTRSASLYFSPAGKKPYACHSNSGLPNSPSTPTPSGSITAGGGIAFGNDQGVDPHVNK